MTTILKITFVYSLMISSLGLFVSEANAQKLTEPVYRVTRGPNYSGTQQPLVKDAVTKITTAAKIKPVSPTPFDLTQRPGEHPLMPAIRVAKQALQDIDNNYKDYTCRLSKRERVDGELMEAEHAYLKVRHAPFSVYMFFLKPNRSREVLYVEGQNDNKLTALDAGFRRRFGALSFPTDSRMVMAGQKYPITKIGIRNLTDELITIATMDTKYGECKVTVTENVKVGGRMTTLLEVVHPKPRKNFRFHIARIYIDNEYRIPTRYEAYKWPTKEGGKPLLDEMYTYTKFKFNNGFTDEDFSPENPKIFIK